MKKQFFYAAMALAVMSSCSNDNDPGVVPNPDEGNNDKVAIELGVQTMNATVTTRGTGFAGNTTEEDKAEWDQQPLNILMVKKITAANQTLTKAVDEETNTYLFNGLKFSAPTADKTTNGAGTVTNEGGHVIYYPLNGAYDFFGFHFDNATTNPAIDLSNLTDGGTSLAYELTTDGTQDIMVAKAALTTAQETAITTNLPTGMTADEAKARAFSSWAARRTVQPNMIFQHLLSRLDFVAKIGQDLDERNATIIVTNTATGQTYAEAYPANEGYPQPEANAIPNGVYIKSIKVLNPKDKFSVIVADIDDTKLGIAADPAPTQSAADNAFTLKRKPTADELQVPPIDKNMRDLNPVNAGYQKTADGAPGEKIGDGIMIVPGENSFEMEVVLMQYVPVIDSEDATDPTGITSIYEWKSQPIKTTVTLGSDKIFEKGKYYTINITVYGFQKIIVTAELSKWQNGGSIDSNPEDDSFKN